MQSQIYFAHDDAFNKKLGVLFDALENAPDDAQAIISQTTPLVIVDAANLPCPMPLLKLKIALKQIDDGAYAYLITTDAHSQTDVAAFCQKYRHLHILWQSLSNDSNTSTTFFNFLIGKNRLQ